MIQSASSGERSTGGSGLPFLMCEIFTFLKKAARQSKTISGGLWRVGKSLEAFALKMASERICFCTRLRAREGSDASQKLDGKDASVGLNDAQRHHRVNFPGSIVGKMASPV